MSNLVNQRCAVAHVVVTAIVTVLITMPSSAAVVTFQQGTTNSFYPSGYALTHDNQILAGGFEDANVGGRNTMQLGTGSPNGMRRLILRWDGLGLMAGTYSSINSAKVVLKKASGVDQQYPSRVDVNLYSISDANAGWNEGNGVFAPTVTGDSSWNHKSKPTVWAGSPGLSTPGTDYAATALSTVNMGADQSANTTYEFALTPSIVDHWITGTNAGVFLRFQNEALANAIEIYASEFGAIDDAPVRPALVIDYTPVPEPTTLALCALGGLLLWRRP